MLLCNTNLYFSHISTYHQKLKSSLFSRFYITPGAGSPVVYLNKGFIEGIYLINYKKKENGAGHK